MTELPLQLRQVRDFFFKQALALSPERTYLHQPELIKNQTIFRLEHLRKHLNNPFLDLDFAQIIDRGQLVDLRAARCLKIVQRRQIKFVNRLILQQHRWVFFSLRGSEAYRGHLDTDDVLAIHLAGAKKWRLHRRQPPRRAHLVELGESEMGPLDAEVVMHAGDVLFLRSGTPQVETVGDYSLHLSFDLCDRAAGIETVFDLLLKRYDRDSLRPYGSASEVLEELSSLGRTEDFRREIEGLQQRHKAGYEEFRRSVAASRVSFFDSLIAAEETKTHQR